MANPFQDLRDTITEIGLSLGGEAKMREAVADVAADVLKHYTSRSLGLASFDLGFKSYWSLSTDAALIETIHHLRTAPVFQVSKDELTAQAPYRDIPGVRFTVRGHKAYIESAEYSICIVSAFIGYQEKWNISLHDAAKTFVGYASSRPQATHAKTSGAAYTSVRKMAETFFKMKLENVA